MKGIVIIGGRLGKLRMDHEFWRAGDKRFFRLRKEALVSAVQDSRRS